MEFKSPPQSARHLIAGLLNGGQERSDEFGVRKQFVIWKPVWSKNIYGEPFLNPYMPRFIANSYRGTLLFEILAMKPQTPISLSEAINLADDRYHEAVDAGRIGPKPGQNRWYCENFVRWISEQGFHIELTGDEFEATVSASMQ